MTDPTGDAADKIATNRALWDDRVPAHVASDFYDVDGFKAGRVAVEPFEIEEVGPVDGLDLVHLQCHFGLDTLSWARLGAQVTGLDFSEPAVAAARQLASDIGIDADFVASDVYDAVAALGGRQFDVVYTGLGALNWLPDIGRWAGVVEALLRPGGFLYLAEFHPFADTFSYQDLTLEYSYWTGPEGIHSEGAGSSTPNRSSGTTRSAGWSALWSTTGWRSSPSTSTRTRSTDAGRSSRSVRMGRTGCPTGCPSSRSCTP
jgi:SAM-dependent methyltransferase